MKSQYNEKAAATALLKSAMTEMQEAIEDFKEAFGIEEDSCEGCFFHEIELRTGIDCGVIQKVLETASEIREGSGCCE